MANDSSLVNNVNMFWWTTHFELLILAFSLIGLISSIIFLSVVLAHHELRQNLGVTLAATTSIGGLVSCASMISNTFYALTNPVPDFFCRLRGYLFIFGALYIFQAAVLQTLHRLSVTIFVHRRQWQKHWIFFSLALAQMSIILTVPLPLLLNGHLPYSSVAKICYLGFNDVFGVLYLATGFYLPPLIIQSVCSFWILRHISRETQRGRAQINVERRLHKEQRVLIRLALPVILLLGIGVVYLTFFFGTTLTGASWQPPPYALHLSFVGFSGGIASAMVANLLLNTQVKPMICTLVHRTMMCRRQNVVHVVVQQ